MFGVDADHSHHTASVDDLAFVTNLFYRCPDFHLSIYLPLIQALDEENLAHKKRSF